MLLLVMLRYFVFVATIPFPPVEMSLLMILIKSEFVTVIPSPLPWMLKPLMMVFEAPLPLTVITGLLELYFKTVFELLIKVNLLSTIKLMFE